MSETVDNSGQSGDRNKLSDTVRIIRDAAADRSDANVELRNLRIARLELLAEELQPVFAEVPTEDPQFDFVLSAGLQPRLWIDATAHVAIDRDGRTYRFLRDSRIGRSVLAESADISEIKVAVTRHIADRMVERQQMMDGPVSPVSQRNGIAAGRRRPLAMLGEYLSGLLLVIFGAIAGIAILIAILSDLFPELGI
ncbi:MAG: hypothetical protein AB3N20_11420 [Rhizobiaceae bacterium]